MGMSRDHAPVLRASGGALVTVSGLSIDKNFVEDTATGTTVDPAAAPNALISLFDDATVWIRVCFVLTLLPTRTSFVLAVCYEPFISSDYMCDEIGQHFTS